ncbi:hypothetical protein O3M35_009914 [Rhynocoris fuscipes]|uniref:Structural maintenance of chromosomes protein 4 n=1 Tax=Rhynocoris fuscipes TaxID=488301 RepID=A0AAW1DBR3_9HEMI
MKNIPSKNNKEIEELKKVEEKLVKARNEEEAIVEKTLASLQRETEGLQENLNQLNDKLIGLNKIKNEANAKFDVAKTELDVYQNKEAKEKTKLEKLKSTLVDVKNRLKEEQNKLSEASANLPGAQQQLSKSEAELAQIRHSEFEIRQKINDLMAKCQEKRHSLQDTRSRGRVLDYMMKQKEVTGIFGRLGDLGGIDAKYDCAISTACGFLDHIVTDTLKTAGKCIDILKKTGIGRASFIGLKEQEKLREQYNKPIKTPENIPRLFDLIKINDERVKPAFYFALRDTLVANDLEQAKRCAYGAVRYRVVTLTGEIIETSGTMSGGGRERRTGRMGRSAAVITNGASDDDLNLLDRQISENRDHLQNVEHRRVTLETSISTLNSNIKKWKMNLSACEMELKELQRQEHQLNQQIKNQETAVESAAVNPDIVEEMSEKLNQLKKELDVAAKNSGEVEAEVKKVKSSIDAATGGRMKEVRQKLQKTVTKLNKVTAEITKLGVEIKAAARDEVKTVNRIASLASEIAENESSILKAEELHHNLIEKIEKTNKEFEQINEVVTKVDKELKEMKSETSSLNKELSTLKATKLNENQKLESITKSIKESEQEINYRNKELQKLVLNEIPVFGDQEKQREQTESHSNELKKYTAEEIEEFDYNKLDYLSAQDSENLNTLRSKVNLNVVEVFREKNAELKTRLKELETVTNIRNEVRKGYDEVRSARLKEFMAGFFIITNKLKEMYQMITLGGDAEFELVDNLDPFSEGVIFSVRPPKKSWKNISNLSGGEKTLSSLALVFALHYYKPSPLYVMDEIDAALDFKNVSIVATYIKERTKNAQFIIISLRSNMFELADLLVGIYKTHNCTKSVTVTPLLYCAISNENNNHQVNNITENNIKETEDDMPMLPKRAKIN